MSALRDTQIRQLYAAESTLWGKRFVSLKEVQSYVDQVTQTQEWREARPQIKRVHVVSPSTVGMTTRRSRVFYKAGKWFVSAPQWTWFERYVLHELAHILAHKPGEPHHGPHYATTYLDLIERQMGTESADYLRSKFIEHHVRFLPDA